MTSLNITQDTSPKEVLDYLKRLREKEGKEKDVLAAIDLSLVSAHDWVVNLMFERVLTYQHIVMSEDAKGENKDNLKRSKALTNMEDATYEVGIYIKKNSLKRWESRLHRFLGRLYDYKGDYKKAAKEYKKAIPLSKLDPEYVNEGVPRWLELEAFMSYSTMMSGGTGKGLKMSEDIYKRFESTKEGKALKKKDYTTWVIWRTGIPVRTIKALLGKKVTFGKVKMTKWLDEAEKLLNPGKNVKVWADFSYRKDEIKFIKSKLEAN